MDFALANSAILLRPNYRKLPESTGMQILENLAEFWKWFHEGLQGTIKSATDGAVEVDESRTLLIGHSAGTSVPSLPDFPSFSILSHVPTPASPSPPF